MIVYPRLIADIGGTNARFAISEGDWQLQNLQSYATADYAQLEDAIDHYLSSQKTRPVAACIAVAGPVEDDLTAMTNHDWAFSALELQSRFGWQSLRVINDFVAIAMALPLLAGRQLVDIGGGRPQPGQPLCVLGPGTGMGAALLIPIHGRGQHPDWLPLATEGGHVMLGPDNSMELQVFEYWLDRGLLPSREHFLSGAGIFRIYEACCTIGTQPIRAMDNIQVCDLAIHHGDAMASQALDIFFGLLGSACGDQVLATGARGGVYLGGGILPRMVEPLQNSRFRERFEAKGPMSHYVKKVRTRLIVEPEPGLLGAAHCALQQSNTQPLHADTPDHEPMPTGG